MKTRTLEDIIDCKTAPLVQWEPVVGEEPSEGKKKEDRMTHAAVVRELWKLNARHITGIIADEARQELTVAAQNSKAVSVTHLTLPGAFSIAARNNRVAALHENRPNADKVRITTDVDSIRPHSQDAVVLNMILGCLATPEDQKNIHRMLMFAAHILNAEGSLIIVRPNLDAAGVHEDGKSGIDVPDDFLKGALDKAGFVMGQTKFLTGPQGAIPAKAPFFLNVCELRPSV